MISINGKCDTEEVKKLISDLHSLPSFDASA